MIRSLDCWGWLWQHFCRYQPLPSPNGITIECVSTLNRPIRITIGDITTVTMTDGATGTPTGGS
jgi:hypothetical protein